MGATVFGSEPAEAQTGYRECILARQENLDTNDEGQIERPSRNRRIQIPSGWTPVGGGGMSNGNSTSVVVLCR